MEGLKNLGATCAINSLIQIICRTDILRNSILNDNNIPENTITCELKEILDLLYNKKNSISPNKFINNFYNIFSNYFNKGEQLDINELWLLLFDKISEEISIPIAINENISNIFEEHDLKINKFNNNKSSNWLKNSQGSFIHLIQCVDCNHKKYNFETFSSIQLDLINNNNSSIAEMLLDYLKIEERGCDEWCCDNCKKNSKYIITTKIWKCPQVLFLTIKRFNDVFNKNFNNININSFLNFKEGSIFSENKDIEYNIQALGLHHGNLGGGHYTSLCKYDNKYIHYDDELCSEIKEDDFTIFLQSNNTAYMVVYIRK